MNLQDYKNSDKYRIENTYVCYNTITNNVDRWAHNKNVVFFGSAEDVDCDNTLTRFPYLKAVTAEELFSISEELFADYIKAIDTAVENGEIELK